MPEVKPEVRDVPAESRFEIYVGGDRVGLLDYYVTGSTITLPHTEIDPAYGGQGLGGELVKGALDDIRSRGLAVRPACSFVRHYIEGHPEYRSLLEGP
jgi:predicted GNAT family acetyltransferase